LDTFETALISTLSPYGLLPDKSQLDALKHYYTLTMIWNDRINLTAITKSETFAIRNIADSLMLIPAGLAQDARIIDVGTGAGLPGIPLKIMLPSLHLTLLDSHAKKLSFVDAVCTELNLSGVSLISARAEELAKHPEHREHYDAAISRAVAAMPMLCELCLPFVHPDGIFYAMKTQASALELQSAESAAARLGGDSFTYYDYDLPDGAAMRIVRTKKLRKTAAEFPRTFAKIKKNPL
jgi:16S rRNA (guanine527-N7)-methyltransferase